MAKTKETAKTQQTAGKSTGTGGKIANIGKGGALAMLTPVKPVEQLVDSGATSPYVAFASPLAKQWAQMSQMFRGLKEGWPIHTAGNEFQHLDPFTFFSPPMYFQATCSANTNGDITNAYPAGTRREDAKEYIWAVILIVLNDAIFPARCRFNGPKCPGYRRAIFATRAPGDGVDGGDVYAADWSSRSGEHKAVQNAIKKHALPEWAMALHTGSISDPITPKRKPKPGERETRAYIEFTSTFTPTSLPTLAALVKAQQDETFADTLKACIEDHNRHVEEVEAMIAKNQA